MDFLEKFIDEINRLEEKYGILPFIHENGEIKKNFDLLNLDGELISLTLSTETEQNMLKAIYYSYGIEYFTGKVSEEELDLQFPIGKTLALNSVLLSLIKSKVNFRYQVESYIDSVLNSNNTNEIELLRELSDWYSVSIINKRLPYKVTMDLVHMALTNNSNLVNLKKSIFIDTSTAVIATAYRFLELTEEEVRVVKCSILYSFLEDAKARRLVDNFLKEITFDYEEKEYSRSDILLKVIASFGRNKYQQFEERFRKYKVWKATNFSNNINNFEEIMVANFNMEIIENIEPQQERIVGTIEADFDEEDEEPIKIDFTNEEEDIDIEATQVIDVDSIRRQYNLTTEEDNNIEGNIEELDYEPIEREEELEMVKENLDIDDYNEEQTINEIMASILEADKEPDNNEVISIDEEVLDDEEILENEEDVDFQTYEDTLEEESLEEGILEEIEDLENTEEVFKDELVEEAMIEQMEDIENEKIDEEILGEIEEMEDILKGGLEDKAMNENKLVDEENVIEFMEYEEEAEEKEELLENEEILDEIITNEETEEDDEMNNLDGLDDLIGSLMPAEVIAERNTHARTERVKEELKVIIEAIQSTKIESAVKVPFVPLKEVGNILTAKNYKIEKADNGIIISW